MYLRKNDAVTATDSSQTVERINIRPGVSILSVLSYLNYRPWFAMAEFVDNSIQSFMDNREGLMHADGSGYRLRISIDMDSRDGGRITIRDNAAGIHQLDYHRAFRPAEMPVDRSGLSEFGMGMKSAACWFAQKWTVRTTALGESVERTVSFDIASIVQDKIEELRVHTRTVSPETHYTEIVLSQLHKPPQGRTIGKIKEHLASIYRDFLRRDALVLMVDGVELAYSTPQVLTAPFYRTPAAESERWYKKVDFDFGLGMSVHGFAALREIGSTSEAGFALFRRGRLIEGSADEGYRPEHIFGRQNSYLFQRLFGELQMEGFGVSHTKDGFRWEEHEEIFLELLKEELDKAPLPLLDQAEGYRSRPKREDLKTVAEKATQRATEIIARDVPQVLHEQIENPPENELPPPTLSLAETASQRVLDIEYDDTHWRITLELTDDYSIGDWVEVSERPVIQGDTADGAIWQLGVRMSLVHPFMLRYAGADAARIEPLLRLAAAISLAEVTARASGVKQAGTIRRNINQLLRDALSQA